MEMLWTARDAAQWVRQQARSLDMSPARLMRESGIAKTTLTRWSNGEFDPSLAALRKIRNRIVEIHTERAMHAAKALKDKNLRA